MHGLAERVQRVKVLLETLEDPYPTPRSALRSDSGPAASRYVPCETCRRSGWVRRRRGTVLCLACDGDGWRRRQRDEGEWDAYVGLPVQEAVALPVQPAPRPRSAFEGDARGYAWERLRASYERHGSYRELRLRLAQLAGEQPRRHRLVRVVLVEQLPRRLSSSWASSRSRCGCAPSASRPGCWSTNSRRRTCRCAGSPRPDSRRRRPPPGSGSPRNW